MGGVRFLWSLMWMLAVQAVAPEVAAGADGPGGIAAATILERMDATISGYDDQYMNSVMRITDGGGSSKAYQFEVFQKGDRRRLVRFTSGEVKGMATLILDRDQVYVFLPGYRKVRRVAASNMKQTFAGSDFSNDDMATVSWSAAWQGEIVSEDDRQWQIGLTPRPGVASEYARAVLAVDKEGFLQNRVDYYDHDGRLVKRFSCHDYLRFPGGASRHRRVVMEDVRTGHRTEIVLNDFQVDQGLSDDLFTVRRLQWGR